MSPSIVEPIEKQIAQLRAAISAQEMLRPTLGDATVEAAIAAIRTRLDELLAKARRTPAQTASPSPAQEAISPQEALVHSLTQIPPRLAASLEQFAGSDGERKQVTLLSSSKLPGGP